MPPETLFHRGDIDGDGLLNLTDPVFILNFLFGGGPPPTCREAANANDDQGVDLADSVYLLNFLFGGGPAPVDPGHPPLPCGSDPADSLNDLGCESYPPCQM